MAIKHEPLICPLSINDDDWPRVAVLVSQWENGVEASWQAQADMKSDIVEKMHQHMMELRNLLQERSELLQGEESTAEVDRKIDELDALDVRAIIEEHVQAHKPLMHASAVSMRLTPAPNAVLTIEARTPGKEDWSATVAAVQHIVDGIKLTKPISLTWAHHAEEHGGDCRHFAIIQADCEPVEEIYPVNVRGKMPDLDLWPEYQTGWMLLDVPAGKEKLAGEFAYRCQQERRSRKAELARRVAGGENIGTSPELIEITHMVNGVEVIPYDATGTIPDITQDTPISYLLIGKALTFSESAVGRVILDALVSIGIDDTVCCTYVDVFTDPQALPPIELNASAGLLVVQRERGVRNIPLHDSELAIAENRPKVTIRHGQVEPSVEVENEELVDVEMIDTAEEDLLLVRHKGYSIYWAIKDASTNGEYYTSDYWVVPQSWLDLEDEYAFDIRDLPDLSDQDMRDYAANFPDANEDQLKLIYAIDTDQLPIDISEFRAGYYEA